MESYEKNFDFLAQKKLYQFVSRVCASQYIRAYELVGRYVPRGSRVLDWGAGSGHFSYFLLERGNHVTAFTLEKHCGLDDHLRASYADRYESVASHDARLLPFQDESFHAVVSIGVLEHVRETGGSEEASLREIRRVLKPGGVFLCYHLPNRYSWIEATNKYLRSWFSKRQYKYHGFKYTRPDIRRLAAEADLTLKVLPRIS